MKRLIKVAMLAATFGFAGNAAAITLQCDYCTPQQIETLVSETVPRMATQGPLYVVDLRGGVIRKFVYMSNWTPDFNPETDGLYNWAEEVPVEPAFAAGIGEVATMAMDAPWQVIVNAGRTDLPEDAHEALRRSNFDANVDRYIKEMSSAHVRNRVTDFLDRFSGGPFFNPRVLYLQIELIYQDGSRAIYKYENGTYTRVPDTSRDSSQHLIPEEREKMKLQDFVFQNALVGDLNKLDDFYDMHQRMRDMGVPIVDASLTQIGYTYVMTCSPTHCTIYIQAR